MAVVVSLLLLLLIVIIINYKKIKRRYRLIRLVDQLPGPVSIPIIGTTWQLKLFNVDELVKQLLSWCDYYMTNNVGLMRFWLGPRPLIVIFRADYAKAILESTTLLVKGHEYEIMRPLMSGLISSNGSKWRSRRRMLTPSFHVDILNNFIPVFNEKAQILISKVGERLEERTWMKNIDLFPFMNRCALDTICETAMGFNVNSQQEEDNDYLKSVRRIAQLSFLYQRSPWFWIDFIWTLSPYSSEYNRHVKKTKDFTLKVTRERIAQRKEDDEQKSKRKAFLDLLLGLQEEYGLTEEDIVEEVDTFMFAGHETTAVTMSWVLWLLAHHKDVQDKVYAELEQVFGESDRPCEAEDLKEMKYLEMVIKESLRLYPTIPIYTRYIHEDTVLNGTLIPEGCTIFIAPTTLHQNPTNYPDPMCFNPENFSEKKLAARSPYTFIPFSAGPRNCIGQRFAYMEMKTVISCFLRNFWIDSDIPLEANRPLIEVTFMPSLGVPVAVHRRRPLPPPA